MTGADPQFCIPEQNEITHNCIWQTTQGGTIVSSIESKFRIFTPLKHQTDPVHYHYTSTFLKESGSLTCGDTTFFLNEPDLDNSFSLRKKSFILPNMTIDISPYIEMSEKVNNLSKITDNLEVDLEQNDIINTIQYIFIVVTLLVARSSEVMQGHAIK